MDGLSWLGDTQIVFTRNIIAPKLKHDQTVAFTSRWHKFSTLPSTFGESMIKMESKKKHTFGIPSRELTYPPKNGIFEDDFPFPKVGYVNFQEGRTFCKNLNIFFPQPRGEKPFTAQRAASTPVLQVVAPIGRRLQLPRFKARPLWQEIFGVSKN